MEADYSGDGQQPMENITKLNGILYAKILIHVCIIPPLYTYALKDRLSIISGNCVYCINVHIDESFRVLMLPITHILCHIVVVVVKVAMISVNRVVVYVHHTEM